MARAVCVSRHIVCEGQAGVKRTQGSSSHPFPFLARVCNCVSSPNLLTAQGHALLAHLLKVTDACHPDTRSELGHVLPISHLPAVPLTQPFLHYFPGQFSTLPPRLMSW